MEEGASMTETGAEVWPAGGDEGDATSAPSRCVDVLLLASQFHGRLAVLLTPECRPLGLTPNEALALIALAREPLPVSGIGRFVGIRPNGASVLVDRLEGRGLVKRGRTERDSRVVSVELTESGSALAVRLTARASDQLRFGLAAVSVAELQTLIQILQRLVNS